MHWLLSSLIEFEDDVENCLTLKHHGLTSRFHEKVELRHWMHCTRSVGSGRLSSVTCLEMFGTARLFCGNSASDGLGRAWSMVCLKLRDSSNSLFCWLITALAASSCFFNLSVSGLIDSSKWSVAGVYESDAEAERRSVPRELLMSDSVLASESRLVEICRTLAMSCRDEGYFHHLRTGSSFIGTWLSSVIQSKLVKHILNVMLRWMILSHQYVHWIYCRSAHLACSSSRLQISKCTGLQWLGNICSLSTSEFVFWCYMAILPWPMLLELQHHHIHLDLCQLRTFDLCLGLYSGM